MSICLAADPNWYLYRWGLGKLVAKWKEIDLIRAAASSRNTALLASCLWNPSHRIDSLSLSSFFVFLGGGGGGGYSQTLILPPINILSLSSISRRTNLGNYSISVMWSFWWLLHMTNLQCMLSCRDLLCFDAKSILLWFTHFCVEQKLTKKSCLWRKN